MREMAAEPAEPAEPKRDSQSSSSEAVWLHRFARPLWDDDPNDDVKPEIL